jgi:lipopolysaccharide assembly outer membrane protein LptD (OstA)
MGYGVAFMSRWNILYRLLMLWCALGTSEAFLTSQVHAESTVVADIQFRADHYERDLRNNTIRGRGNAWLKRDTKEIWADYIEVDMVTKRATANGNVHIRQGDMDIWCSHAGYNLEGEDAVLEDATILMGKLVLTGAVARRLDLKHFEIDEGTYSNCNVDLTRSPEVGSCPLDWKLTGRHFSVTLEGYAHISDVLIYVNNVPVFYTPYFIAPVKTQRQTGFLMPSFTYTDVLGNGLTIPFFWTLGTWHDLSVTPTYYTKMGYHLGLDYRYAYSDTQKGDFNVFLLQRRFGPITNPVPDDTSRPLTLGVLGEWATDFRNVWSFGKRGQTRQILRLVSNPYYTLDYGANDLKIGFDMASLRSRLSVFYPMDSWMLTGEVEYHQSLIMTNDTGVDQGPVTQLPSLQASYMTNTFLDQWLAFEWDNRFDYFYRPQQYDPVSATLNTSEIVHTDPLASSYHDGDYIRAGQRLQVEPRLLVNFPMPQGLQFQPILRAGSLLYHFDLPQSSYVHREYLQMEFPLSLYLSKTYETGISGFEKINHVFQPRFTYARVPYQGSDDGHPFFYVNPTTGLSNPRFDLTDQLTPFEYMRFELINRFRRKKGNEAERFFRLEVSEQYNLRTYIENPLYSKQLGPIEILSEFQLWRFVGQVQGEYQLQPTTDASGNQVYENVISSSLEYRGPNGDDINLGNILRINADDSLTQKSVYLTFYKVLPLFFDINGSLEYSYKQGQLLGYQFGLLFASKPRSCWNLSLNVGRSDIQVPFFKILFKLDFGMQGANDFKRM